MNADRHMRDDILCAFREPCYNPAALPPGSLETVIDVQTQIRHLRGIVPSLVLALVVSVGIAGTLFVEPPILLAALALLAVVSAVGSDRVIYRFWRHEVFGAEHRRRRYRVTLVVLPCLVALAAAVFLRLQAFASPIWALFGTAVAGLIFAGVVSAQAHGLSSAIDTQARARFALNILGYVSTLAFYAAIYAPRVRSLMSATAVVMVTFLVSFELLRGNGTNITRTLRMSAVIALVLGQMTWALNYWTISPLVGGAVLLVLLYACVGIVQSDMMGKLTRRVAGEYSAVAACGVAILLLAGGSI
jgi:hypothetical protein